MPPLSPSVIYYVVGLFMRTFCPTPIGQRKRGRPAIGVVWGGFKGGGGGGGGGRGGGGMRRGGGVSAGRRLKTAPAPCVH